MIVSIDVEDEAWRQVKELEGLAERSAKAAMRFLEAGDDAEVNVLFTSDEEARRVNKAWRERDYAPNVLSFPAAPIPGQEAHPLGDIVLASGVVAREANEQGKPLDAHVAHLLVHGVLHLGGHDHMNDREAARMESAEIEILKGMGFADPYTI
ncbi:MAG: rRNA maturation RNase YbeY [Parvibaculaceae bacterium]